MTDAVSTIRVPALAAPPPQSAHGDRRRWLASVVRPLLLLAAALLGIGLVAPCMRIETSFGRYDGWIRLLAPEMAHQQQSTYSLLGGIVAMIDHGSVALGLLLLAFSCVFPTLKLVLMAWTNETLARGGRAGRLMALAHHVGKFSMLDVMVLAMLVIAVNGVPASELRLRWGVWAFAGSVVLSLIASLLLHRMELRKRPAKRIVSVDDVHP